MACIQCPKGTWSDLEGRTSVGQCKACPAGDVNGRTGLASEAQCSQQFVPGNRAELQEAVFGCIGECGHALRSASTETSDCFDPGPAFGGGGATGSSCINAEDTVPNGRGDGKYGAISSWNLAKVTSLAHIFFGAVTFNQPIENWDVSQVTSMQNIFYYAFKFNQPLGAWDVSRVHRGASGGGGGLYSGEFV